MFFVDLVVDLVVDLIVDLDCWPWSLTSIVFRWPQIIFRWPDSWPRRWPQVNGQVNEKCSGKRSGHKKRFEVNEKRFQVNDWGIRSGKRSGKRKRFRCWPESLTSIQLNDGSFISTLKRGQLQPGQRNDRWSHKIFSA